MFSSFQTLQWSVDVAEFRLIRPMDSFDGADCAGAPPYMALASATD